ncbi:MAG: hypothetical protein HGA80_06415 [Candidatus Omnitrophica bacterium]|nr:hypothetical protein [Candidatus Omnitrophota bacterium]
MRAQFVLQNARRINPDIFITEFFPFGRQDYLPELMPAIEYLKDRGCKIMASIGYPCSTDIIDGQKRELANVRNRLIALYDQLLIHTPAAVENSFFLRTLPNKQLKASYQQFYKTFADKIVYTGYLLPYTSGTTPQRSSMIRKKAGAYTIIVSRGGGAVYPKLITAALQASGILGDRYRFIISCGPATSQAEHDLFAAVKKQHAHRTVILKAHIPDLDFFFRHCDLAVSLCGYNTAVQLLSAGTPGIVVPFVNPASPLPSNEQTARALLLKDRLDSAVLSYQQLSARSLADEIRRKCAQPAGRPELPDDWLNGRADTCRRLFHC